MPELMPTGRITQPEHLGEPEPLADYLGRGGYEGLRRALGMEPEEIIAEVAKANVIGRGGAGYPAASKWAAARAHPAPRYLVVNGAEGEPGSFKDRQLMAVAPHQVLEGLAIAARAVGAEEALVYVNSLFPRAKEALLGAAGELAGTELGAALPALSVRVELHHYIAGEESALLAVLMGRPAWPSPKPPYPTERGYLGRPTVVNNPETLAHAAVALRRGAEWFRQSRPALFSVGGDVVEPVVIEARLGTTAASLIEAAGGLPAGDEVAGVLPGGFSLPWLEANQVTTPMEPSALEAAGTGLGASVIVIGRRRGLGAAAASIAAFFARETCGVCPICVTGTARLADALSPAAGRLLPAERAEAIAALAAEHRHRGICTLLDTAAAMAESAAPRLSGKSAVPLGSRR